MTVIDPVCGMEVEEEDAEYSFKFGDETYFFCCESCRDDFVENPQEYLDEELYEDVTSEELVETT
jgi:Cu+-exporting ATPase